jgi:hypothetical protein
MVVVAGANGCCKKEITLGFAAKEVGKSNGLD